MRKIVYILSLSMIFMIPWEGVLNIANVGSITRIIGVLTAACWLGSILETGRIRHIRPFHILVLGFVFWTVMTLLWTSNYDVSKGRIITYLQIALLFFIIWDIFTTREKILTGLQVFILGAWLSVYSTISNFLFSNTFRGENAEWTRYSGFGFNADDLAFIVALALPIAWYLVLCARDQESALVSKLRILNMTFIPLAIMAILVTATRGALIATAPFFFYLIGSWARVNAAQKVIFPILIVGCLYGVQPLIPQTSIDRLSTTQSELTEGDIGGRRGIWEEGIDVFWEHSLGGVGIGTFRYNVSSGKVAHNAYISVLVEAGAIGFFLFTSIIVWSFFNAVSLPAKERVFWLTVLLIWSIGVTTLSWEHRKPTWLFFSFILTNVALYSNYRERFPSDSKILYEINPHNPGYTIQSNKE